MSRARDLSKLGNPNIIKADENSVGFGTQVASDPANANASLVSAGIVSATAFYGDGSNLDGVASAGLGTALSEIEFNPLTVIYQTSDTLSINQTVTVDPPDSTSNVAYTQYSEVKLEDGADLIIADGDDFIPDILGLSTEGSGGSGSTYGNGVFGTIYADNIERSDGRGAPTFPQGANVVGVLTAASGSFSGNISIGGTLTYEDVTNVDSVGLITARNGINITGGDLNAASNLILKTGGTERVRIQSNGSAQFTPEGSTSNPNLLIETSGDNIRLNSKKDTGNGGLIFVTQNAGTSSERLRISKDGSIGIGGANYGTSGQVLTSGGASAAPQWATPGGGGLTEIDSWGLYIGNWSAAGGGGWTNARWGNGASGDGTGVLTRQTDGTAQTPDNMPVGTGVTHTNGLFTFPSAGTWEMTACFRLQHKNSQATEFRAGIIPTVDGTSYVPSESNVTVDHAAAGYIYLAPMSIQAVFNFTNTATTNAYVRLNASNEIYINYKSSVIFKKLA